MNLPNDVLFSLLKYHTLHDNNASILTFQISRKSLLGGSKPIKKVFDEYNLSLTILYGGSVNEKNSSEILSVDHISGFLIGNSSLDGKEFANIARNF